MIVRLESVSFSPKRIPNRSLINMADQSLSREDEVSLLGMTLSDSLCWSAQSRQVACRASESLGVLFRPRTYLKCFRKF